MKSSKDRKISNKIGFYITNSLIASLIGTINLGICTTLFTLNGLTFLNISIIYTCILLSSLIFEYPSGIIADKFGRKKVYAFGLLCIAFQYFSYAKFTSIILLYLSACIGGIGGALISGSFQAWIIVEEKHNNIVGLKKGFALLTMLGAILSIICSFLLTFIKGDFNLIYTIMSAIILILSIFTFIVYKDNYGEKKHISDYNKDTFRDIKGNKKYYILIFIYSLSITYCSIFILFWQPKILSLGINSKKITAFYAVYLLGVFIINLITSKINITNKKRYIGICNIVLMLSFILMSLKSILIFTIGMFLFGLGFGSINPFFFAWISEIINEDNCASIISLISAAGTIISIIINVGVGYFMDIYGINVNVYFSVFIGVIFLISLIILKFCDNKKMPKNIRMNEEK